MPSAGAVTAAGRVLEVSGHGEELLFMLFPHLRGLRVGQVEDTGDAVVIRTSCRAAQARCPLCGAVSTRVHGGYARVVADGAAGGRPVLIALSVRRFRCPEPSCPRATFAEQAGGVSERYRRRSVPLSSLTAIAQHMFSLMLRNMSSDGFVFADPLAPGSFSAPGCIIASPSWRSLDALQVIMVSFPGA